MFWPLVLPAKIAFWGLIASVAAATVFAPRFAVKRPKAFALSAVLAVLAFVPSCISVQVALDFFRFGEFHYDNYDRVNDFRVYRYLPEGVTDVTLEKGGGGFRAKFSISRAELESWIDEQWALYGDKSELARAKVDSRRSVGLDEIARKFGDFAEPLPSDAVEYAGPVAPNGAGFTIWYSAHQGLGYEQAGYW
jgi:hypothetical protein